MQYIRCGICGIEDVGILRLDTRVSVLTNCAYTREYIDSTSEEDME